MRIGIIGSGIEVYCCAHRLLDLDQDLDIQIFDEKAESGMYGEEPVSYTHLTLPTIYSV